MTLIPDFLRASAQLTKNVVVVGSYQRVEIWDVETYHKYLAELEANAEAIAEGIEMPVQTGTSTAESPVNALSTAKRES